MDETPTTGRLEASFWFDLNRDGARDPGEPMVPGFLVALPEEGEGAAGYDGIIEAELPAGTWRLHLGSWEAGLDFGPVEVVAGATTTFEKGFLPAQVNIVTYLDANQDGAFQVGEEYPYALRPELLTDDGSFRSGPAYSFGPLLPGSYHVVHDSGAWYVGMVDLGQVSVAEGETTTVHIPTPTPTETFITVEEDSSTWVGSVSFRRGGGYVTGPYLREEPGLFGPIYYFEPGDANGTFTVESAWWLDGMPVPPPSRTIVTVLPMPDPPVAQDDAGFRVTAGQELRIPVATLLANDTDADGDVLSVTALGAATGGAVRLAGTAVVFTAAAAAGPAQFQYTVADPSGRTATATVTLAVDAAGTPLDEVLTGTPGADHLLGLAGNDTLSGRDGADTLEGGSGADMISGEAGDDRLTGGVGDDRINGGAGKDGIRGGAGADRVAGGGGNDSFEFHRGDLVVAAQHGGQMDQIVDLRGAGGYKAWTGVEDDFIGFFGFSAGARLAWVKDMGGDPRMQIYAVYDGNGSLAGNLLVQMADGTAHLAAGDYAFYA